MPEDAVSLAVHRVSSLLRVASEPVLFARVKLTMAADPAVGRPEPGPGEWRHQSLSAPRPPYSPRPPGERTVVRRKSYTLARQTPDDAATEAELLDYDFHLFTEKSTGEDSVIYRTPDGGRLGAGPGSPADWSARPGRPVDHR